VWYIILTCCDIIHKLLAAWSCVLFCAGYLCVLLYGRTSFFRVCMAAYWGNLLIKKSVTNLFWCICWCELINSTKMHGKYNVKFSHVFNSFKIINLKGLVQYVFPSVKQAYREKFFPLFLNSRIWSHQIPQSSVLIFPSFQIFYF
jgi:hypothetical protein